MQKIFRTDFSWDESASSDAAPFLNNTATPEIVRKSTDRLYPQYQDKKKNIALVCNRLKLLSFIANILLVGIVIVDRNKNNKMKILFGLFCLNILCSARIFGN